MGICRGKAAVLRRFGRESYESRVDELNEVVRSDLFGFDPGVSGQQPARVCSCPGIQYNELNELFGPPKLGPIVLNM